MTKETAQKATAVITAANQVQPFHPAKNLVERKIILLNISELIRNSIQHGYENGDWVVLVMDSEMNTYLVI
jgi:hypothetical protein